MIKIAQIGYGYWGPNLARNFFELSGCSLKYICDLQEKNLRKAGEKYPSVKLTKNYEQILADNTIDAVVIATPVSTHFPLAKKFLEAGKHILVEKPLCASVEEAEKLMNISEKKKRIVLVSHTFLYSPPVIRMKELLDKKTLGRLFYIDSSRVNLGLFQPDVSVVWDLAPHDASIMIYWLSEIPQAVACHGKSYIRKEIFEVAYITLFFSKKIVAHLHISWLAPCKLRRTVLIGSKRMAVYDDIEPVEKIKIYNEGVVKNPETFGEFQLTYRSGDIISPHLPVVEPLKNECADFLESIEKNKKPKSDIAHGVSIVKVLAAAEESAKNRGKIVKIS